MDLSSWACSGCGDSEDEYSADDTSDYSTGCDRDEAEQVVRGLAAGYGGYDREGAITEDRIEEAIDSYCRARG